MSATLTGDDVAGATRWWGPEDWLRELALPSRRTLARYIRLGRLPQPDKVLARGCLRWSPATVRAFLAGQQATAG